LQSLVWVAAQKNTTPQKKTQARATITKTNLPTATAQQHTPQPQPQPDHTADSHTDSKQPQALSKTNMHKAIHIEKKESHSHKQNTKQQATTTNP
jgi:hypothetical protein